MQIKITIDIASYPSGWMAIINKNTWEIVSAGEYVKLESWRMVSGNVIWFRYCEKL
jgi:hypothetical protein